MGFKRIKEAVNRFFRVATQAEAEAGTLGGNVLMNPLRVSQAVAAASAGSVTPTSSTTLTNKTIDGDNNTLQDIGIASLKTVLADANKLIVRDATGAVVSVSVPTFAAISNTGTLTLPTATDTLVGRATTDTLTNKTLTAPVIATIVNTGTLTLPTATDTLVGRATTDTLTNKTLTAPVIATIVNTGTLTLPTATDTLVGRATTDTLSNKTLGSGTKVTLGSDATGDMWYRDSSGNFTRLAIGSSTNVLTVSGGLPAWSAAPGGTTGFTLALNTSSPNNTVNASSITASGGTTNQDLVIAPKGTGAIVAAIPDSTATGGNKRGSRSTDVQTARSTAAQVVSGAESFGAGSYNTVSSDNSCAIGYLNSVSGAVGFVFGRDNVNQATNAYVFGRGLTFDTNANRSFGYHANNSGGTRAMTISASDTFVIGNSNLWLANNDNTAREIRFYEPYNTTGAFPNTANYSAFKAGAQSADITYTLPLAAAANLGYCLMYGSAGQLEWNSLQTLRGTTAYEITTSPNNTVNASLLLSIVTTTNGDMVLQPKGTGALLAQLPDSTATGGNKRGLNATDTQTSRSAATEVASGNYSAIIAGQYNTASGAFTGVLAGYQQTVSGDYSASIGGQTNVVSGSRAAAVAGLGNTIQGNYSAAIAGAGAKTTIAGQIVQGVGNFSVAGDAQSSQYVLMAQTTDATVTEMLIYSGTLNGRLVLQNDSTWTFSILIAARRSDADNESAGYEIKGVIDRNGNAASTALVGSVTTTILAEDTAAWDVTVTADTTNGALKIEVTGEAAKTIKWVAFVRTVETIG